MTAPAGVPDRHAVLGTLPAVSTGLLAALLALDLLLIAGHLAFFALELDDGRLLLNYEAGYGEVVQYAKLFGLAMVFAVCAFCARRAAWLSWALVFAYLGVDDAFYLHETFGRGWQDAGRTYGFRTQDLFEVLFSAAVGVVLLGALALAWRRGDRRFRRLSATLAAALGLLVVVGVGVDVTHEHAWVQRHRWLHHGLVLLEDGGELVVVSAMIWLVAQALEVSRETT